MDPDNFPHPKPTVDAPSGEHELKDGTVVVVDGEGKITGLNKPDESGQGSLSSEEAPVENLAEAKLETEVELADNAIVESDELPLADHSEEEAMDEHGVREEIIEAIMEVVGPRIESMEKKLVEHDEAMKAYMSSAADSSVSEIAFNKEAFGAKQSGKPLNLGVTDLKKMQYDSIIARTATKK